MSFRNFLLIAISLFPFCAFGANDTENDSIDNVKITDLHEFVVKGATTYIKNGVLNVIPNERQKEDAYNGTDLLSRLALPMLKIDPVSNAISYAGSGNVAFYINGRPASDADIQAMKTTDVIRVEYMDYPTDPRFNHDAHVVNFVMQKYIYGGYTRLSASESCRYLNSIANIYSKFEINNFSLDVYFSPKNSIQKNNLYSSVNSYFLKAKGGSDRFLREENRLDASRTINNSYPLVLRALVAGKNYIFTTSMGYTYDTTPVSWRRNSTQYSGLITSGTTSYNSSGNNNSTAWWGCYYMTVLPKNFTFKISPVFSYGKYNRSTFNNSGIVELNPVSNKSTENIYNLQYDAFLQKNFGKHFVYLDVKGIHSWSDIDYSGSSDTHSRMNDNFLGLELCYGFKIDKLSLTADAGCSFQGAETDGISRNDIYPFAHLRVKYDIRNNSYLSLWLQYATYKASLQTTQTSVIQQNNFMYITGNPNIKDYRFTNGSVSWTWLPSNMISIFFRGAYNLCFNRVVQIYEPYNNGTAILQRSDNNGNSENFTLQGSLSFNNIANVLTISLRPTLNHYHETGFYKKSMTVIDFNAAAYLTLPKGFSVSATYSTPSKSYSNGRTSRISTTYSFGASWSHKNLNIGVSAYNFLHNPKWTSKDFLETAVYSDYTAQVSPFLDRSVVIRVSYIFSYGKKKVRQQNELQEMNGPASGALPF